ncbi:MAG: hypothetical protein ABIQ88_09355 [Chitinophagaceae bacterium]
MTKKQPSLVLCIIMDVLGYATYAVPGLGELGDIVFAPVSAIVFYTMFGSVKGALFNFTEEILPGMDFIPSFTLMWCWQYFSSKKTTNTEIRTV